MGTSTPRPLHAAAYYLNPHYHYNPNFKVNANIKIGLHQCLEMMVPNASERCKIDLQLESFNDAKGLFGIEAAKTTRDKKKKLQLNGGILMGMNAQNYKGWQFEF
jgi:hypothetical protein